MSLAERFEGLLGHHFSEAELLEAALTHASFAQENQGGRGNERLEFLGDAALDLVVSRALYEVHPDWDEGQLTRARARLVNGPALAERARRLGVAPHIRLGRSEQRSEGQEKPSILANVFEALVGAVYLDAGLAGVERVVRRVFPEAWDRGASLPQRDAKTRLNEWGDARSERPRYRVVHDSGEEDADDRFHVEVELEGEGLALGVGRTKRAAERAAAERALAELGVRDE